MNAKIALRKTFREIRADAKSAEKDNYIYLSLIGSEVFKTADTIFLYYSVHHEADTLRIISTALDEGKAVSLPRCNERHGNMDFYLISDLEYSLTDGAFSLKEPDASLCEKADFGERDICVVPALAFDKQGYRLGYGGGYYDRFLSNFKGVTVGLCYEECLCDALPHNEYDIKVDIIITDENIYRIK